ncbi:alanine dehydrogenase [Telmatospirillum siberiense]|uniref:Alanine dehydrogenase n=1 Tax=Telmatospirillum siberiense TaxID=382514 RepID=A0A2N3PT84_9PROT|nr:alanine dehydrogenase [Telmatospirillum siberiense]PKU23615.1 alanine dehydrogenase [Telmatospirillum siberiense]
MKIGVPKETKIHEYRVGLVPAGVRELVAAGHKVAIEKNAGLGSGIPDADYEKAGATILGTADEVFATSDMIVKVKEPLAAERKKLRPGQILFTYLHLAPDPEQTHDLLESGAICVAYETVTAADRSLPLLTPMSEVAGRMSIQVGAACLEKELGGRGVLLGGVPGVPPANVVILGAGVAGSNAALIALGTGANVTIVDRSLPALRRATDRFGTALRTAFSTQAEIERLVVDADLVIGAVLVAGATTPKLVTADMVKKMQAGSVLVDIAIDQGGCFETSHATTHAEPTFVIDDVVHYCVANMPGAVARTSTFALANATLPFALSLANKGGKDALASDPHLLAGLNVHTGKLTYQAVAEALGLKYTPAQSVL